MSLYFIETAAFTRRIGSLGLESELSTLQSTLAAKDEQSTLTPQHKRQLKRVAEALKADWDTAPGAG